MSDTTNPARVLRDAADYLTWHGWTRKKFYAFTSSHTPAACAMGAIVAVVVGRPAPEVFDDEEPAVADVDVNVVLTVAQLLAGYLGQQATTHDDDEWSAGNQVTTWNDQDGRTANEVVSALLEAADEWDRQNAVASHSGEPHAPGLSTTCPLCQSRCYCTVDYDCVYCAAVAEREIADYLRTNGGVA
jgi:hypothetical protein